MMDGIQKTVYLALFDLTEAVGDGKYGSDDNFDHEAFEDDLQDEVIRVTQ